MARYSFSVTVNTKKNPPASAVSNLAGPAEPGPDPYSARQAFFPHRSEILTRQGGYQISSSTFVGARPAASKTKRHLRPKNARLKRALDIVGSSIALVVLLPLLALLAMLVRASGPGPIIFRQKRIGADGKPFVLLKFRTMCPSPEFSQATLGDPRVTAVGRFMRRLSFDEFVQLINVLRGEMSLVGPRPHAPETRVEGILFEEAVLTYRERYAIKPGITGLAQIRGQRGETRTIEQLEERVASDIEYIETWSIWLDIQILIKTIPAIFKQINAY